MDPPEVSLEGFPSTNTSSPVANALSQTSGDGTSRTLVEVDTSIDQALLVDASLTSPPRGSTAVPSAVPQVDQPVPKKKGRPRKYGPDRTLLAPPPKRGGGTPPGTSGKQQQASFGGLSSGTAGADFTPHVITITQGEDICSRIISFSQQVRRSICILSACGVISNVTLRQPSIARGNVKYEGNFVIVCLSGSLVLDDSGGPLRRRGGLSGSFASPDGRVIGGAVEGVLIAASPIQVIVGSFLNSNSKANKKAERSVQIAETSDPQTACPADALPDQNLTSTSSMGN